MTVVSVEDHLREDDPDGLAQELIDLAHEVGCPITLGLLCVPPRRARYLLAFDIGGHVVRKHEEKNQ